jgi:hypothetical protein
MNLLAKPVVAVIICLAAAVCFGAAAQIHAMSPSAIPQSAEPVDVTLADAIVAGRSLATAVDFWVP